MRTTLTLDADVAARLQRLRRTGDRNLKSLVNDALRAGLDALEHPAMRTDDYSTPPVSLGPCLVSDRDNVQGVLSIVEGDHRR